MTDKDITIIGVAIIYVLAGPVDETIVQNSSTSMKNIE